MQEATSDELWIQTDSRVIKYEERNREHIRRWWRNGDERKTREVKKKVEDEK